jgi:hypothetical protein
VGHSIVVEVYVYFLGQSSQFHLSIVLGTIPENKTEKGCQNHKKEDAENA